MKKRIFAALLSMVMVLSLLPAGAFAAEEKTLPDWYFLFAIFKNVDADVKNSDGVVAHQTYTMTQDEIDRIRDHARVFEGYMNEVGVIHAHVDVVEIDTTITRLDNSGSTYGSWLTNELAEPLLSGKADLDKYDHVFCVVSLNVYTGYLGLTGGAFANGTGHSCINIKNREYCLNNFTVEKVGGVCP